MEFTWLSRWQPQVLAVLRIVAAFLFILHGTMKLFHFPAPIPTLPPELPPLLVAASVIEMVGGTLVLLGLFTRPAAFILSGEMAVAYWMSHAPRALLPVLNMGEAAILFCFVFLYIAAAGPGAWSIDRARMRGAPIR